MEENKNTPEITVMSVEESQAIQADDLVNNGLKLAQMGIAQMCAGVKMMHDGKLYKHFNFQNFEDYCQSKGFTRRHGERLIKIAEMLESENATTLSHFEKIGVSKLFQLAMLEPEQREEIIQTVNVESVTVKELQSQISQMKTRQKQDAEKITELTLEKEGIYQQMEAVQERIDGLEAEKQQAQKRIEELENRPTDVYKDEKDQAEIERLTAENNQLKIENEALEEQRTELETKVFTLENDRQEDGESHSIDDDKRFTEFAVNLNQQMLEERQRIKEESQEEIQRANLQRDNAYLEVEKLKKQLDEQKKPPEESPQMKAFKIRLATLADSIELLVKFLCENPEMSYLDKSGQVLKGAENSLTEIRKQVQE